MSPDPRKPVDAQSATPSTVSGASIGEYLIRRLQDYGVRHVFGIPGDYVLSFYAMLEKSPLGPDRHARAKTAPDSPPTPTPDSTASGPSASPTAWAG